MKVVLLLLAIFSFSGFCGYVITTIIYWITDRDQPTLKEILKSQKRVIQNALKRII